jgi:hypothetical protein
MVNLENGGLVWADPSGLTSESVIPIVGLGVVIPILLPEVRVVETIVDRCCRCLFVAAATAISSRWLPAMSLSLPFAVHDIEALVTVLIFALTASFRGDIDLTLDTEGTSFECLSKLWF